MEISMTAGFLPANEKAEEAVLGDPSSMFPESQFASSFVIAEDAPSHNVARSCEEISATQEAIPIQECPVGEEPLARSCASPSNSNAEVMDVACNPLINLYHIDEIESLDVQPFNAQETLKHEEFLPVDGASSLCAEQIPSTQNYLDPVSSTEPMIGNLLPFSGKPTGELCSVLAEERPRDNTGMDCSVSEELTKTCESMTLDESIISHANVMRAEPTNAIDKMLIKAMNDGTNPDMHDGKLEKQVCGARASADTVSIIGHSALQQEGNSPAMTDVGSGLHESASIEASQEIVTYGGLKQPEVVTSIQKEDTEMVVVDPFETLAAQDIRVGDLSDNEISAGAAVVDVDMKQAGSLSDSHLTYSKDTLESVMPREVDEREVAVGVAIQFINDGVVNDAPQGAGIDEGLKHFESSNSPLLDPAEGRDVGQLQEADFEMKTVMAVGSDIGQLQKAERERETEWEKAITNSSTILVTGASGKLKAEEETISLKAQSEEIDKDEQDPNMPSQKSEGGLELEHSELSKDVQIDSETLPADDVLPEQQQQQQPRKRGRKPGKKATKRAEQDASIGLLQESEPDKETEDSPSKVPVENEMKRELRKRGKKSGTAKVTQKEEEDVCFVCFDGGNLILCDKRSCPKAYHVECTGRESEFFEKKGQWFCGWHVCSQCSRSARLNCYMCPSALCSTCMKGANFLCIRKGRGLCEGCYPLVYMIEHNKAISGDPVQVDFNDKETYEGLFKEYWEELKLKLSLTPTELDKACKAKEAGGVLAEGGTSNGGEEEIMGDDDGGSTDSEDRPPTIRHARLMKRKRLTRHSVAEDASASEFEEDESDGEIKLESTPKKGRTRAPEFDGWASKELADIIQSLKEDPKKKLPLFGVKKLLWRYIDENKLADPRRRGQIICDERLKKLFGKKHVGRFEMMKLIGLHVASPNKPTPSKGRELLHGESDAVELDDSDENQQGKKKPRRKVDDKRFRPDPSEYAAVNVKNINMIYLKRSVLDELRNDPELESKAVGAFVRIRVPGTVNKNDACYRLVQVVGVKQIYDALDPEKVTDVILEILNLHKREEVTADLVSNQDLVEEECRRLRQSVRCGFIKAMRVGELEERARALREAKVKDWREFELLRLSHLRDRASEKGRKKELRECVEKLQLLSTPEEKERQLKAPFDIDADPYMDPDYESDEEELPADDGGQGEVSASQSMPEKAYPIRFPEKGNSTGSAERQHSHRDSGSILEPQRNLQDTQLKTFAWGPRDLGDKVNVKAIEIQAQGLNPSPRAPRDKNAFTGQGKGGWGDGAGGRDQFTGWNQGNFGRKEVRWTGNTGGNVQSSGGWKRSDGLEAVARFPVSQGEKSAELASGRTFSPIHTPVMSGTLATCALAGAPAGIPAIPMNITATMVLDDEKEKLWCYQDPTRTVQGPFAMEQLRKWEKTNLFPLDLRIWRVTESQDASILLSDALAGRFTSRGSLSLSQKPNPNNLSLGPMQGTHVNGIPVPPVQGLSANNFSIGPNGSSFSSGSTQGILANPMLPPQRPNIQSFPMSPIQGLNTHGFVSGPIQGPGAHALSSGPVHAPSGHVFHPVPTQGSNAHNFAAVPTQGSYVNNFSAAPSQGTNFNVPLPGPMQGPNVTGYPPNLAQGLNVLPGQAQAPMALPGQPQGPNVLSGQMQAPVLLPGQTQAPNVLAGHMQGPHFNNVQAQGPHVNSFPMGSTPGPVNNNLSQMGQVISNSSREFRNASMPNRPTSDWQDTGRRSGPEQHFGGPASQTVEGNAWGGGRRIEHPVSDVGSKVIQTRSPWRNQGPGAPRHDSRDTHNRGHFGRGQNFRGSDHYQGSEGRLMPKKELFCKYFQRGLCKKGQACDFRH